MSTDFSVFLIHMKILDRESPMTPLNEVHEICVTVQIMILSDQNILNNLIREIDDFNCHDIGVGEGRGGDCKHPSTILDLFLLLKKER